MPTFVTADIHGNYQALLQCLDRSKFNYDDDTLICLGDICDGYDRTYEVIEKLLEIKNLIVTIGNHDVWLLNFVRTGEIPSIWYYQGGNNTLRSYRRSLKVNDANDIKALFPASHRELLESAKLYHVAYKNSIFMHGGFDDCKPIETHSIDDIVWNRDLCQTALHRRINNFNRVYVGHTDVRYLYGNDDDLKPKFHNNLIMVDTGAGSNGKLTFLNVDTVTYVQSDIIKR